MEPTLELVEGGTALVCPSMSLRLYLDLTNNSTILNFYERSMEALKGRLKFVIAESANRRTPVNDKTLTMVPTWLKKPRPLKGYFIEFYENQTGCGGARLQMVFESRQASDFTPEKLERRRNNWRMLERQNPGAGGLGLTELLVTFPLDHPLSKPETLLDWITHLKLVEQGPLVSGSCGLALNDYGVTGDSLQLYRLQQRVAALVLEHPGLAWNASAGRRMFVFRPEADDLIPLIMRVNWLTLIGRRSVEYLGGIESLNKRFAANPAIIVREFPWGILVQASPEPQLGDVGHRDFIPVYRDVAEVLRPIRVKKIEGMGRGFSDEAADEWLNAFDREY